MSENKSKLKFDPTTAKTIEVSDIPTKASKGVWQMWIPILQEIVKNPSKAKTVTEKQASLPAIRNQIAEAVKTAKIEGIVLNSRNVDKIQTLFISYKKPVKKQ